MMQELAQRAVACKGWRWMPGMRLDTGDRLIAQGGGYWHCGLPSERGASWIRWRPGHLGDPMRMSLPDLSDPATLGCLLALVREAWPAGWAWSQVDPLGLTYRIMLWDPSQWPHPVTISEAMTEAEALVRALEVAP